VPDNIRDVLELDKETVDKFEKIVKRIDSKNNGYTISKTDDTNALASAEISNELIKISKAYKEIKNPEDFLVVLIHELTHISEKALKTIW